MKIISEMENWNLDIDRHINRVLPASSLARLPTPISRFLGYRKEQQDDIGNVLGALWSCVGAVAGLALIAAIFNNSPLIQAHHPPTFIASFGASAILEYNVIRSPLGQPRNCFLGHTLSAIVGVGITKIFSLHSQFQKMQWLAGSISCGVASAVMLLTGTVHPPGGASAVLAATEPQITAMGWYFVPLVMLGTVLMLVIALITNNIQRQFPTYWWTPLDLKREKERDCELRTDPEGHLKEKESRADANTDANEDRAEGISITAKGVSLPDDLSLNEDEAKLLGRLKTRLRKRARGEVAKSISSSSSQYYIMKPAQSDTGQSTSDGSGSFI